MQKPAVMSGDRALLNARSQSSESLKPRMVFELFELVGVLRVRPRLSEQYSKGKSNCKFLFSALLKLTCKLKLVSAQVSISTSSRTLVSGLTFLCFYSLSSHC